MTEDLYTPNSIRTRSGRYFDFTNIRQEDIILEDIAHALSYVPRFAGHLISNYSVGQHSVLCSELVSRGHKKAALLHDASEFALADVPSPVKSLLPDYRRIEDQIMRVMAAKFRFQYPLDEEVKRADRHMLELEWNALMLGLPEYHLEVWTPEVSKAKFLNAYYSLI